MEYLPSSKRLRDFAQRILDLDPQAQDFLQRLEALKDGARAVLGKGRGRAGGVAGEIARRTAVEVRKAQATALHRQIRPIIDRMMEQDPDVTSEEIARELDRLQLPPPAGEKWAASTVRVIRARPADWTA